MKMSKLLALALVLLISVGTLAGSTIAWFTDTETSLNTIQSGSLDVELQFKKIASGSPTTGWNEVSSPWETVVPEESIFNEEALYEPGYTEAALLKVSNVGDLALQYKLDVEATNSAVGTSVLDNEIYLSNYLKLAAYKLEKSVDGETGRAVEYSDDELDALSFTRAGVREYIGDTTTSLDDGAVVPYITENVADKEAHAVNIQHFAENAGTAIKNIELWPKDAGSDSYDCYLLVLYMPEEVGNEANYRETKPVVELGINLYAAQVVEEADSFGNDYDETATYDDADDAADKTVGGTGTMDGYEPADSGNSGIEAVELPFTLIDPATMTIKVSDGTLDGTDDTVEGTSPQAVDILNTNTDDETKGSMTLGGRGFYFSDPDTRTEQIRLPENTAVTLTDSCLPGNNGDGTFVLIVPENTSVYLDGANTRVSMSDSASPFGSASLKGKFILYEGTDKEKAEEINNSIGDAFQGFYYGTDTSNYQCLKYREDAA